MGMEFLTNEEKRRRLSVQSSIAYKEEWFIETILIRS